MNNEQKAALPGRIGKHIRTRLVSGVLVLIPLAVTIFILNLLFSWLTSFARPLLRPWLDDLNAHFLTLIALVTTVVAIYLVGLVTTHILGRQIIHWGEQWLLKMPIVKTIYSSSKQVVDTISSSTGATFQSVVLVQFPSPGSLAVGFITGTMLDATGRTLYRVFVATTPNPTSGFLILVPRELVQFTDITVEDGLKTIVSGGMLAPKSYLIQPEQTPRTSADPAQPTPCA